MDIGERAILFFVLIKKNNFEKPLNINIYTYTDNKKRGKLLHKRHQGQWQYLQHLKVLEYSTFDSQIQMPDSN